MEHPFVGVIDQLGFPNWSGVKEVVVEIDMLPHHLGHVGVTQIVQDHRPPLGVILHGPQTGGFAQVVEEGAAGHQRQEQVKAGIGQGLAQKAGHLHYGEAMLPDIGEHAVYIH